MKKKIIGMILVAGMMTAFVGCGKNGTTNEVDTSSIAAVDEAQVENIDTAKPATADENGNYLINGSFEEPDFTGWTVTNINDVTEELNVYDRATDCFDGIQSLHFYSGSSNVDFSAEQTVNGLEDGTYKLTAHIQGDAAGDENAQAYFYALVDGKEVKVDGELNGYVNWYTAELPGIIPTDGKITVGIRVSAAPGAWGTIDDISLIKE